jgi:hypothetical protein
MVPDQLKVPAKSFRRKVKPNLYRDIDAELFDSTFGHYTMLVTKCLVANFYLQVVSIAPGMSEGRSNAEAGAEKYMVLPH